MNYFIFCVYAIIDIFNFLSDLSQYDMNKLLILNLEYNNNEDQITIIIKDRIYYLNHTQIGRYGHNILISTRGPQPFSKVLLMFTQNDSRHV